MTNGTPRKPAGASCLSFIGHWSLVIGHFLTLAAFAAAPVETKPVPRPDALAAGGPAAFEALPPFVRTPQPAARSLVPLATKPWLPPARGPQTPRLLPADRQGRLPLRPVADRPEVAVTPGLIRFLRTASGAYAVAPDAADIATVKLGPHAAPTLSPRLTTIPLAKPFPGHRWLPGDVQLAMRLRVVHDSPPLERASDPFVVRPPRMPLIPPAVGGSPDTATEPLVSAAFVPKLDRPAMTSDPTWDHSYQAALARAPEVVRPAAPFQRLAIPDPFETVALVRLRRVLPDADPPSCAPGLPPRPTFPVKP